MITIVIAVVGWILFAGLGILYWIGNRLNSQESNALALYGIALVLSDEFRTVNRSAFDTAIAQARERGSDSHIITYCLIEAVTENAKNCYKPESDLSTISIVTEVLSKNV